MHCLDRLRKRGPLRCGGRWLAGWVVPRSNRGRCGLSARRSLRLAVTPAGAAALSAAEQSMGERLEQVLAFARDPEALLAALCDLDDAVADRMQARLRRKVQA